MRAITVKQHGGAEQLQMKEFDKPVPKDDEVLIKVKAAAVNRTDIMNRESESGYLQNPILGVEVSGIVEQAGKHAKVAVGTKVMGLVNGGGYAEYAVMPEANAMLIPENISFEEAAAIPVVFLKTY